MIDNHLIAIPVYNEQRYIASVLKETKRFSDSILIIDDGSTDATAAILDQQVEIEVLTHPENRGYGKSLADAFGYALLGDYEWLITMDCDEQHEPAAIPRFLEAAARDNADIISGTRYPKNRIVQENVPADRRRINHQITDVICSKLSISITDAFCGFKAYRVAALRSLRITVPGYAMPMQFWVQVARAKLRVEELPVSLIYNDPDRHFGGVLDDPEARLAHYWDVLERELAAPPCQPSTICCAR